MAVIYGGQTRHHDGLRHGQSIAIIVLHAAPTSAGAQLPPTGTAGTTTSSSSSCELLAESAAALPTALALPEGAEWPSVLNPSSLTAAGGFQLRSLAWLCFRGAELWDEFGAASHALIHTGRAGEASVLRGINHLPPCHVIHSECC
jgi:hypothetical protein